MEGFNQKKENGISFKASLIFTYLSTFRKCFWGSKKEKNIYFIIKGGFDNVKLFCFEGFPETYY